MSLVSVLEPLTFYHLICQCCLGGKKAEHEQAVSRQSSTVFGGASGAAVDGGSSRFFSDGSTSMTDLEMQPWWQVCTQSPHCREVRKGFRGKNMRVFSPSLSLSIAEVLQKLTVKYRGISLEWRDFPYRGSTTCA